MVRYLTDAIFLLTRPSRGATLSGLPEVDAKQISTHTPLAGRDSNSAFITCGNAISTHTPLAGRDIELQYHAVDPVQFLLTRPSRGATDTYVFAMTGNAFLLTRPSRGATNGSA